MSHQKIGMFGGAFAPPHLAHRALAQAAIEQLQLDALRVLPTGQAWHKARWARRHAGPTTRRSTVPAS